MVPDEEKEEATDQEEYYKKKNSWIGLTEKIVLPVLGFLCVWVFTTINTLEREYSKLSDANLEERIIQLERRAVAAETKLKEMEAMWGAIKSYDNRINANQVQSQVNALVNDKYSKLVLDRLDPGPVKEPGWLEKILPKPDITEKKSELIIKKFEKELEKDPELYKQEKIKDFNREQMQRKK
jgi:hypothetical protein